MMLCLAQDLRIAGLPGGRNLSQAAAVVFLAPDNGLEIKSSGGRDGDKHVTYEEVASFFSRMDESLVPVIYQHLPQVYRRLFLYGTLSRLIDKLRRPIPVAISDNQVAFIILAKNKNRQTEVRRALREYTRSHLEICD